MPTALSRTSPVSCEVGLIAELLAQNLGEDGLHLPGDKATVLLRRLELIKRLIASLEHELGTFCAVEQASGAAGVLGDLCLEVLQGGVLDNAQGAPVVYPDFSKGKRK
jgi:hypothetical protein